LNKLDVTKFALMNQKLFQNLPPFKRFCSNYCPIIGPLGHREYHQNAFLTRVHGLSFASFGLAGQDVLNYKVVCLLALQKRVQKIRYQKKTQRGDSHGHSSSNNTGHNLVVLHMMLRVVATLK